MAAAGYRLLPGWSTGGTECAGRVLTLPLHFAKLLVTGGQRYAS
jgi:hypothetical protein